MRFLWQSPWEGPKDRFQKKIWVGFLPTLTTFLKGLSDPRGWPCWTAPPVPHSPLPDAWQGLLVSLVRCRSDVQYVGAGESAKAVCDLTLTMEWGLRTLIKSGHKCLVMWWHVNGRLPEALSKLHCWLHRPKWVLLKYSRDRDSSCIVVGIIQNITTIFVSDDYVGPLTSIHLLDFTICLFLKDLGRLSNKSLGNQDPS